MPTTWVYDTQGRDPFGQTVHFELAFPAAPGS